MLEAIESELRIPKLFSKAALQFCANRPKPSTLKSKTSASSLTGRKAKQPARAEPFALTLSREYVQKISGEHRRAASQTMESKLPAHRIKVYVDYAKSLHTSRSRRPQTVNLENSLSREVSPSDKFFLSRPRGFVEMAKQKGRDSEGGSPQLETENICNLMPLASSKYKRIIRNVAFSSPEYKPQRLMQPNSVTRYYDKNFTLVEPRLSLQVPDYAQMMGRKAPSGTVPYLFLDFYDYECPKSKVNAPLFRKQTG